jgi:hypothetical protein
MVTLDSQVLVRHVVDKRTPWVVLECDHHAAYLEVAVWVVTIHYRERDAWVAPQVTVLLLALRLAEADVLAIPPDPDRGRLRLAVRSDGCNMCERRARQQVVICFRDHASSLSSGLSAQGWELGDGRW